MTLLDDVEVDHAARPEEPPRSATYLLPIALATVLAGLAGLGWGTSLLWGALLGTAILAGLTTVRRARSPIDIALVLIAGAASARLFVAVFRTRSGPVEWALSLRASLAWILLGAAVGWVVHRNRDRQVLASTAWTAAAAFAAGFIALQVGATVGYLETLRTRDIADGAVQIVGQSFFVWLGLIVILVTLATTFSFVVGNAVLSAVAWLAILTVVSFNQIEFSVFEIFRRFGDLGDLAQEFWPPKWRWPKSLGQPPSLVIFEPFIETLQIAVVGATTGVLTALPLSFLASRATARTGRVYWAAKTFLNVIRTVPDLFWGVLFATAVGFGTPFAGALAMVMFSLSIMAKLLSETIDAIDLGPLEAATAAGASHWEMIRYAAFPQVAPNYVAYGLYIFELNIRASVVIGIVGAGGIGRLLDERRNLFQWDEVMAIVIVIFVAVILIEIVSIYVRKRIV